MPNTYSEAAYPAPWQVLGVTLKPFSLGHYIKLNRLGCAFVADGVETATLGDLLLGVAVCSMDSHPDAGKDPFWNWLSRSAPEGRIAAWWYRLRLFISRLLNRNPLTPADLDMLRFGKRCGEINLPDKCRLFQEYISAHSKPPAYWEVENSGSKKSGAHWSHAIMQVLVAKCGYTLEDAHNAPMTRAMADFFKHIESEGGVRLMSEEEARFCNGI
jgi:hypothetical protein